MDVLRLGESAADYKMESYSDISMNGKNISFLAEPVYEQDAATMGYVDNYIPKIRDYITPLLTSDTTPTGYVITASRITLILNHGKHFKEILEEQIMNGLLII